MSKETLDRDQKIAALESTFDEKEATPAEPAAKEKTVEERLHAHYADVPLSYFKDRCPIKTRLTALCQLIEVDFDERCPDSLHCLIMPTLEDSAKAVTGHADPPEGWSAEDVETHNTKSRKAERKVISAPIPVIKLGTVCASCTRGGSTSLEQEQEGQQTKKADARDERKRRRVAKKGG